MDKIKVLIADDTKETVDLVRKVLNIEQDNFEIVGEASNGEEVLELIPEARPDIILMDINMPVLNGLEATEKITSDYPSIAVVIMSVQGESEYLRKAMLCGAKEYIVKPFNYNTLLETIRLTYDKNKEIRELELQQMMEMGKNNLPKEESYSEELIEEHSTENADEEGVVNSYISQGGEGISTYIGKGFRAVSLAVQGGSGVSNLVSRGDFVDVIMYIPGEGEGKYGITKTILQNSKVLGIDKEFTSLYVTLSVHGNEVEKVVLAENIGKLKLVIRHKGDMVKSKESITTIEELAERQEKQEILF